WHFTVQARQQQVQELLEPATGHFVESRSAAQTAESEELPHAPVDAITAVAEDLQQGGHKPAQVGPIDPLARLQGGRRKLASAMFVFHFRGKGCDLAGVFLDGPAPVGCRGRTGETQSNAPMIAGGHEHKGKEPAGERLGSFTEALVNAAAALVAQEDTAA